MAFLRNVLAYVFLGFPVWQKFFDTWNRLPKKNRQFILIFVKFLFDIRMANFDMFV